MSTIIVLTLYDNIMKNVKKEYNSSKCNFYKSSNNYLILFYIFLFFIPLSLFAQQQNEKEYITLSVKNTSIQHVLNQVEKETVYRFTYRDTDLAKVGKITISVKQMPVETFLKKILLSTGLTYRRNGNSFAIIRESRKDNKKDDVRIISGIVTDGSDNTPLIGASVKIRGKDVGVITDLDGKFSLPECTNKSVLEVSYIGYDKRLLPVGDLGFIEVKMGSSNELEEVIVVGAGTQKKVSVTGSIATVKGLELRAPSSSLTSNFAGKLAGVISSTTSGEPGSVSEFYIRGVGTFGGRATPLILMDDVEISAGDLDRIPAESIESFSILKDASATAIYGARGANGVMLITTKKGMENTRTRINVTVENSFVKPMNRVEYVDGPTWMNLYNEALTTRTPSATPKYSDEVIEYTRNGINPYVYPNVDWYGLMFKDFNMNQRANINMQGGGSKVTYYMGIQANHDTGLLDVPSTYSFDSNINDWNYIFQNNISYKPTSTTKIDLHLNAQFGNQKGPGISTTDIFNAVYNANPVAFPATYPTEEGDNHIRFGNSILTGSTVNVNPYAAMMSSFSESNYSIINASLRISQELDFITKGLSATVLVNMKSHSSSSYTNTLSPYFYKVMDYTWDPSDPEFFYLELLQKGTDYIKQGTINRYSDRTFYFDARVNYNRRFGEDHTVSGMLMYMQREYRSDVLPQRNQGLSGRFTYDYQNKYFAEFNFGYNGTERLASGHRFEFFPAMSLGWAVSNESFWEPLSTAVTHFKIRGSYGLVGSDETGLLAGAAHFLYINNVNIDGSGIFSTGPYDGVYISKKGPGIEGYAVENASWERAKKFDIGVDLNLFDQVSITFDYFHDRRDRILQKRGSWPVIMGYAHATPWSNIGKVDNKGFELSVNWKKEIIKDMFVDLRGNFTYTQNKYVYNDEPDYPYVWQTKTGKPLSCTYGYIADGLFEDEDDIRNSPSQKNLGSTVMPGDIKYRDVNGDGAITTEDQVMLSRYGGIPRIQYGFGLNWTYKNIDFGVFFNGSAQRTLMIDNIAPFCSDVGNQDRNLMKFIADNYWSEASPNPEAAYPRLGVNNSQVANNMKPSSFWMRNGNFLRFKTLELGYSFSFCRIYLSGDNLAVWSPFKLWDPELSYSAYPLQRAINIGAQFTF